MHAHLVNDIAICIIVAWLLAVGAQLLRQPLILAYLLAGVLVGPLGIRLVHERESIETIAALGLLLLLFMIGLEIDLKRMLGAGRTILVTGACQIAGGSLVGVGLFWLLGFPLAAGGLDALYLGAAAALSSTVIVVKILYDKRELGTFAGRLTLGILVLQDVFAILFLAVQPQLADPAFGPVVWALLKVVVLMGVAFTASRYALPPIFRAVARLPELVLVGALAWCFLMAGLAGVLGLSREMGALVAGVALSTFPYALDVVAKVTSLRDFFLTLFFVALGMSVPAPTWTLVVAAISLSLWVFVSRMLTVFLPLYRQRVGHRASLLPALNLSQVSELSLVIMALGLGQKHLGSDTVGVVAYAFAMTAVASSYALVKTDAILPWACRLLKRLGLPDLDQAAEAGGSRGIAPRVFLLGFSWTASSLLEEVTRRCPELLGELAVVDFNPEVNRQLRQRGVPVVYGDISQRDTLHHAGIEHAEVIVCTLPNTVLKGTTNLRLVRLLRELNPHAEILSHAELFADVPELYAAGASYVCVPRLIEAMDLLELLQAARQRLLADRRAALDAELADRREVIP